MMFHSLERKVNLHTDEEGVLVYFCLENSIMVYLIFDSVG